MKENVFWDRRISKKEAVKILKDESDPRFVELAALLLSRTGASKEIFNNYLDKARFCRNWRRIKIKMRHNDWNDTRINFWDEVYRVVSRGIDKNELKTAEKQRSAVSSEAQEIGRIIKETRKNNGWSQKELAEKTGFSQQMISFIENGYLNISLSTLTKIAHALSLTLTLSP